MSPVLAHILGNHSATWDVPPAFYFFSIQFLTSLFWKNKSNSYSHKDWHYKVQGIGERRKKQNPVQILNSITQDHSALSYIQSLKPQIKSSLEDTLFPFETVGKGRSRVGGFILLADHLSHYRCCCTVNKKCMVLYKAFKKKFQQWDGWDLSSSISKYIVHFLTFLCVTSWLFFQINAILCLWSSVV
jgi:hypothetical protein